MQDPIVRHMTQNIALLHCGVITLDKSVWPLLEEPWCARNMFCMVICDVTSFQLAVAAAPIHLLAYNKNVGNGNIV